MKIKTLLDSNLLLQNLEATGCTAASEAGKVMVIQRQPAESVKQNFRLDSGKKEKRSVSFIYGEIQGYIRDEIEKQLKLKGINATRLVDASQYRPLKRKEDPLLLGVFFDIHENEWFVNQKLIEMLLQDRGYLVEFNVEYINVTDSEVEMGVAVSAKNLELKETLGTFSDKWLIHRGGRTVQAALYDAAKMAVQFASKKSFHFISEDTRKPRKRILVVEKIPSRNHYDELIKLLNKNYPDAHISFDKQTKTMTAEIKFVSIDQLAKEINEKKKNFSKISGMDFMVNKREDGKWAVVGEDIGEW